MGTCWSKNMAEAPDDSSDLCCDNASGSNSCPPAEQSPIGTKEDLESNPNGKWKSGNKYEMQDSIILARLKYSQLFKFFIENWSKYTVL